MKKEKLIYAIVTILLISFGIGGGVAIMNYVEINYRNPSTQELFWIFSLITLYFGILIGLVSYTMHYSIMGKENNEI